jgi:hypothetical protein
MHELLTRMGTSHQALAVPEGFAQEYPKWVKALHGVASSIPDRPESVLGACFDFDVLPEAESCVDWLTSLIHELSWDCDNHPSSGGSTNIEVSGTQTVWWNKK